MVLLGSTGSIGVNTLILAKKHNLRVEVLVAGSNYRLLQTQIDEFKPKVVVVSSKEIADKINYHNVFYGVDSIIEAIKDSSSKIVVNALVGFLGLRPTLAAIKCGKKVALANKESLVTAGKFIDTKNITPIDSEHFGLWYLLDKKPIKKMIVTASGGAFRDKSYDFMKSATLKDVLNHPNWQMGQKITIDSATMVNKMFELIEAYWLFKDSFNDLSKFDAIIETKSIIHALIDFEDGSTTAHIANTDMKLPIAFAIGLKGIKNILKPVNLLEVKSLEFKEISTSKYLAWSIKDELLSNPSSGLVLNTANEIAIKQFLDKKIGFLDISKTILKIYDKYSNKKISTVDDIFLLDKEIWNSTCKD